MKFIRSDKSEATEDHSIRDPELDPWKILVVDDEPDVISLTKLNLKGFRFAGRGIKLIEASSGSQARQLLSEHSDVAVALIDVVMETDNAGLELVNYIRNDLHNRMIRLLIRTGQPGVAPERSVIDNFDIDDYKDKTELTAQKLYTAVRSALKAYRDLEIIEYNRHGLECVLNATPQLYQLHRETLESLFEGVLTQVIGTCRLVHTGLISTIDGMLTTVDGEKVTVRCGTGALDPVTADPDAIATVIDMCLSTIQATDSHCGIRDRAVVVPLRLRGNPIGFIYLETSEQLTEDDSNLIQVLADQCSAAIENFCLHMDLHQYCDQLIDSLALTAEFKDSITGHHIRRLSAYTHRISVELGIDEEQAKQFADAARLHDVGKVGIPDAILNKPGPLTEDEFAAIKRHPEIGSAILSTMPALSLARDVALCHHERWNGKGYPKGLSGEQIPLVSRIVAVVDVFDALTSHRPYKSPWTPDMAIEEIVKSDGMFDPNIVAALLRLYKKGDFADLLEECAREAQSL